MSGSKRETGIGEKEREKDEKRDRSGRERTTEERKIIRETGGGRERQPQRRRRRDRGERKIKRET